MKKRFFKDDAWCTYTSEALNYEDEICDAITEIVKKWIERGHSPRECEYLALRAVTNVALKILVKERYTKTDDENK